MASVLLQTFSLVYLLALLTCTALLSSHDEECLALSQFKQSILRQNYDAVGNHMFHSWSNTSYSDCCLSDGVMCSSDGHVIGLDWSQSSLSGIINSISTLFKLVHLQMLNLSMNNFLESQIPPEIARLKQLRILDLSFSGFKGQIPNEISHLIQLSLLDLSGNPLMLQGPSLEYLLENMTRLEILHLSGVDLSSPVPRFLVNLSSLKSIELEECQLQNEFPSAIFHLPKLKHLSIANNSNLTGSLPEFHNGTLLEYLDLFSTGFSGIIPESISNINRLEVLDLHSCSFSGRIPGSLPNLTRLTYLDLSENELTGLVPSLASLSKLTVLKLAYNKFEIGSVYGWISKLTKLRVLKLYSMNIHQKILPYLANLTQLSELSMMDNFIFGHIPFSFMNLTKLTYINLELNQLRGQISSSFLNIKSLERLMLCCNNFSGMVSVDSFQGLNKLWYLNLGANKLSFVTTTNYTNGTLPELEVLDLSSCNLKKFPDFLRYQRKLKYLDLSENKFEGLIPNWVWNNSQKTLRLIFLQHNFITGFHQQSRFLPWTHLEVFSMKNNQLQGPLPIPPQTIVIYDVSNNNLSGEIPPLFFELTSLQALDLSSNRMTGNLPKMQDRAINLIKNRFTGMVSKSLANCTNLVFLSLADNFIEDVFPLWLGTLPELQVLLLRSNKFYGSIQGLSSISSQFLKLRIIDISNNKFSGELPDKSFQTWNAMKSSVINDSSFMISIFSLNKYATFGFSCLMTLTNKGVKREYVEILNIFIAIDLSCNNFEGPIPQSLLDLIGLESLNLSNNHFTSRILPSFGNLKNLESFDLSQNELSEQIPQQLLQLGFLAIFNVSFNHLDGRIPQGKQFNTFENNSYLGNPGLCGKPLSKECENSKVSTVLPPTSNNEYASLLPSDGIDWMVILLGLGCGLVIGIVIGNFVYARYDDWLLERFGLRKNRWVRPLTNTRRNKVVPTFNFQYE